MRQVLRFSIKVTSKHFKPKPLTHTHTHTESDGDGEKPIVCKRL